MCSGLAFVNDMTKIENKNNRRHGSNMIAALSNTRDETWIERNGSHRLYMMMIISEQVVALDQDDGPIRLSSSSVSLP